MIERELAEIRAWWARGGNADDYMGDRMFPIAGSQHDQLVPDGIENPYWELIRHLPSIVDHWDGVTPYGNARGIEAGRHQYTKRFAWSIPSPGDISWMAGTLDGRGLVEVGAGAGYWAWQAQQAGIDTVAYEPYGPADNDFVAGHEYVTTLRDGSAAAGNHPDRALMLCWPSYDSSWAADTLAAFKGDLVVYVGETAGGCCADDDFFELLGKEWTEVGSSPHHVTWWGVHCRMAAYGR